MSLLVTKCCIFRSSLQALLNSMSSLVSLHLFLCLLSLVTIFWFYFLLHSAIVIVKFHSNCIMSVYLVEYDTMSQNMIFRILIFIKMMIGSTCKQHTFKFNEQERFSSHTITGVEKTCAQPPKKRRRRKSLSVWRCDAHYDYRLCLSVRALVIPTCLQTSKKKHTQHTHTQKRKQQKLHRTQFSPFTRTSLFCFWGDVHVSSTSCVLISLPRDDSIQVSVVNWRFLFVFSLNFLWNGIFIALCWKM